jgi:DNA-binding transcriptional ArsR family regulator
MSERKTPSEKISHLMKSISNPVRLQILLAIGQGESCVCHLEAHLGLRQAYISQQLMILRKQKLIKSRREGKYIYYRLAKPQVLALIRDAGEIAGVSRNAFHIQDHASCECPNCSSKEEAATGTLPAGAQA